MFLLKKLIISETGSEIMLKDGIEAFATTYGLIAADSFWGDTTINVDQDIDYLSEFEKTNIRGGRRIKYASSYKALDSLNGFKHIIFNVSKYDISKFKGYILFIKRPVERKNIITNGTLLFDLYPHEIVVELKNGQSIRIDEVEISVKMKKLVLVKG